MSLQNRFRLLLLIFGVSVVANVLVSVWCIHFYVREATGRFTLLMFSQRSTDQIRRLVDELRADLQQRPSRDVRDARYRTLGEQIQRRIEQLPEAVNGKGSTDRRTRLTSLATGLADAAERYVRLSDAQQAEQATALLVGELERQYAQPLQQVLAGMNVDSNAALTQTSAEVGDQEAFVTGVLSVNAVLAFLLTATGVHLVRNWVLRPVAELKNAAEQHAAGNLGYRIERIPRDELGTLSHEINRMADSLIDIQRRLVEQERMAAIGEVTSTVAHNIRNPLAGIRASAQSSIGDLSDLEGVRARLTTIVKTVDSLNRWLRELLQVSQPIQVDPRPAAVVEVVSRVVTVLEANAERRGIKLKIVPPTIEGRAQIDPPRIEQAVLTIIVNALDASPAGSTVRLEIAAGPEDRSIEIRVTDTGEGIPPEVLKRIASPYFSTKPGGTGIGLYLAKRVAEAHGGAIEFESSPDHGTKVTLRLPAAVASQLENAERGHPTAG